MKTTRKPKIRYEIQQDSANCWRVIRTGPDGVRRAWDNPPCKTRREAQCLIEASKFEDATLQM